MCHCTQCRRMTGHIMAATAARRADFSLVSDGELKWYVSSVEARRGFCGRCGSTLFWEGVGLDGISIAAGTLDDTRGLKIACHVFVADQCDYYHVESGARRVPSRVFRGSIGAWRCSKAACRSRSERVPG